MSIIMRISIIVICLIFIIYIVSLVSRKKLLLKYSLIWLSLSIVVGFCAVFPTPLYMLASLVGFETASNFIFVVAIFFLLAICLSLSIIASRQTGHIKTLIQEIALIKKEKEDGSEVREDTLNNQRRGSAQDL